MDKTERHNRSVALYNKLLELNAVTRCLTDDDLCQIILKTDGQTREAAWQRLLHDGPSNQNLCFIIQHVPALREQAWKEVKREMMPVEVYYFIMRHVEPLRTRAWNEYCSYGMEVNTQRRIIRNIPSLRLAAAKKLLDNNPTLRDLYLIRNEVRELRKEVEKKLEEPKYQLLQKLFDLYHG